MHPGVVDAVVDDSRLAHHRHSGVHLLCRSFGSVVLAEVGVLVGDHGGRVCIGDGETGISGSQTVLVDVQTVDLYLSGNAETDSLVNDFEDDEHDGQNIGIDHDEAQQLDAQLAQTAAVEQALADTVAAVGEEAHGNGTPDAVCKVDGDSAHGVIDLRNIIEELDAQHHENAGDEADDESTKGRNGVAACGDGHQTSQRAVERHGDVGLAVALPGKEHGHAGRNCCRKVGVEADQTGQGHGLIGGKAQGRAAVEAEPAEPEDEYAQRTGGQVVAGDGVGLAVLVVLADAGTQQGRAQHGDDSADVVDGCRTGKVVEAHALEPAAAPHPVAADGVDHQRNGCGVDAVGFEVGALGHGAGDDGGCRCAEDSLEHDVHPQRDVEAQMRIITLNEGVEPADESAGAAEHQAEADEPVAGRADAKIHIFDVLHKPEKNGQRKLWQASFFPRVVCPHFDMEQQAHQSAQRESRCQRDDRLEVLQKEGLGDLC